MKIVVNNANEQDEPPATLAVGKQTPRRLRRAAEIVAAAREAFLEKGFERASVSEIATRVGVVEGLLYSYFPTKRDMLNEVLRGMYEPLIREMEEGFGRLQGLRSRMRFLVWRQLRVYVEDPGLCRLVLHEVRTRAEYFNSALHDLHVRYTAFLMRTVRDAVASGELPADTDAEMVRGMVYGGIEHRMWGVLFGRETVDVEVTADAFTDMLLRGILPPGDRHVTGTAATPPATRSMTDTSLASAGGSRGRQRHDGQAGDLEARLERLEKIIAAANLEPVATPPRRKKS